MPIKQSCIPSNIFEIEDHHLFLGCSVLSFSASVGFSSQVSNLTVQLVQDDCPGNKIYFDENLEQQTWTDPDETFYGITYPIIGTPVYFRVGNFEACMLVQRWEQVNDFNGNPSFSVTLTSPDELLQNTQLIIGDYSAGVGNLYNIVNVFGYMESFGDVICPATSQSAPGLYSGGDFGNDGAVFGSLSGAYGGADVNDNGMNYNQILAGTRLLLSSSPPVSNVWSPYGRIAFKATTNIGNGMGLIAADDASGLAYYYLDLDELPVAPDYFRISGSSLSVSDFINQITEAAGFDYYIELVPVKDDVLGPGIHKFIKIRTANRFAAPALNSIDAFVSAVDRVVLHHSKGRELRNEITSSFVVGGPKQSFYQAEQSLDPEGDGNPVNPQADDMIIPFFGLNPSTGNVLVPTRDPLDGFWKVELPTSDIAIQLASNKYLRALPPTIIVSEKEMICAASGFDVWMSYAGINDTDLWNAISVNMKGVLDVEHLIDIVIDLDIDLNKLRPMDFVALGGGVFKEHDDPDRDWEVIQIGYSWIKKIVDDYYGKKFQVRVPFTCGREDEESGNVLTSEEPSEGGWTEVTPVLGLAHPSSLTDFFALDDNRLGAFCRFDNEEGLELSSMNINDFVVFNNIVWSRVNVESEYVYIDRSTLFSPRAVITLPQAMFNTDENEDVQQAFAAIRPMFTDFDNAGPFADKVQDYIEDSQTHAGSVAMHFPLINRAILPDAVGFGIKSNVLKYGPWGAIGPAGGVQIINDDGLVPWEYGGFENLNEAGESVAEEGVTFYQVSEAGSVTIAGYPDLPLGAELLAADAGNPFAGGVGTNLIENRSVSQVFVNGVPFFAVGVVPWDGTYGPNVTDLTTQVGSDGLQTTYGLRTWTPKFGRFSKGNAERLKNIGQQRLRFQKQVRAANFVANFGIKPKRKMVGVQEESNRHGIELEKGVFGPPKSPHEMLVGELIKWNDGEYTRPLAMSVSSLELPVELSESYSTKGFMSLDGLIRPVSMDGAGDLPRYVVPKTHCQKTASAGAQPPTDKPGAAGAFAQYNTQHDIDYLNPWSNPAGFGRSSVTTNYSDTPTHGHDIEVLGRGETVPNDSMVMPIQGYNDTLDAQDSDYEEDYKGMALKGPLLIQQWGYDTDGFPVPNNADVEASCEIGIFTDINLKQKFLDNWLRKSKTWPVAPLDVRLDRKRGVWTIPTYRSVVATLEADISPFGNGLAYQISGPILYDTDGAPISQPEFIVHDRVGNTVLRSGDKIIAEYDPYQCEYQIIEHKGASGSGTPIKIFDVACNGDVLVNGQEFTNLVVGTGLIARLTDVLTWRIDGNYAVKDSNQCHTPFAGFARITAAENYETLNFGAGLFVHAPTGIPCELDITAGILPSANKTGCFDEDGLLTVDDTRLFNRISFEGGTRAIDDAGSKCAIRLRSGIEASNDNGEQGRCINELETEPEANHINHKLVFLKGIHVRDNDTNDCQIEIGAGVEFSHSSTCYTGGLDPTAGDLYSDIILGAGLTSSKQGECQLGISAGILVNGNFTNNVTLGTNLSVSDITDCGLTINADNALTVSSNDICYVGGSTNPANTYSSIILGAGLTGDEQTATELGISAGLDISTSDICVNTDVPVPAGNFKNKIILGNGLRAEDNGTCGIDISAGIEIDNNFINDIELGDCLELTDIQGCSARIDFINDPTPATSAEFINQIEIECDVVTGFIQGITYHTKILTFNSCGLFIDMTDGNTTVLGCP